jgi:hypothetical protein
LNARGVTFKDRSSLTGPFGACHPVAVQTIGFTLTVSGLSGANTLRAVRDVLDHPDDPEAESRFCAALALCRSRKSTEGVAHFTLTPIQKV